MMRACSSYAFQPDNLPHVSVLLKLCDVTAWKGMVLTEGLAAGKHRRDAARKQSEGDRGRPHHEQ